MMSFQQTLIWLLVATFSFASCSKELSKGASFKPATTSLGSSVVTSLPSYYLRSRPFSSSPYFGNYLGDQSSSLGNPGPVEFPGVDRYTVPSYAVPVNAARLRRPRGITTISSTPAKYAVSTAPATVSSSYIASAPAFTSGYAARPWGVSYPLRSYAPLATAPLATAPLAAPLAAPLTAHYGYYGAPLAAAPLASPYGYFGAPLAAAPLASSYGYYGAPLAAAPLAANYGYYGAPLAAAPLASYAAAPLASYAAAPVASYAAAPLASYAPLAAAPIAAGPVAPVAPVAAAIPMRSAAVSIQKTAVASAPMYETSYPMSSSLSSSIIDGGSFTKGATLIKK